MTLSSPLLAAVPLVAGLMGPALIGATPDPARHPGRPPAAPAPAPSSSGTPSTARTPSAGRAGARPGAVVEHVAARRPADHARVLGYWTRERMARALPIDLLDGVSRGGLLGGSPHGGPLGGSSRGGPLGGVTGRSGLTTAPGLSHGALKLLPRPHAATGTGGHGAERHAGGVERHTITGAAERPAGTGAAEHPTGTGAAERSAGTRAVERRHQSARPQIVTAGSRWTTGGAVTRTTGRVFMTLRGVDFVCSAGTVRSANRDVVVTAGHCVKDGTGPWAENWTFVPGYREGGAEPYGRYAARRMFVAGPWSRSADDDYDVGMVALTTWADRHVTDAVGAQEIAFNTGRGGQAFGFGYPADPPYTGEHLVYCAGKLRDDPHGQTRDQGLGCDMTAGSSGGPWLSGFDHATGWGTMTSLSSFKYSDDRRTMYGPYFGDTIKTLYTAAERA
ncbi:hypothetical protein GCM10010149_87530 [Nonomuraea roseoviolacea subsp. roseoviolacea]|uniref:trypsin-like serine peptidase n=1 Tax=Nonomuraea roseoviolacea TaxID=103837 RepID=UPI0031DEA2F9